MSCSVVTSFPSARGPGRAGRWRGTALCSAVTALVVAAAVPSSRLIAQDSPDSIHYKGITITPGGFFAGEAAYRTHSEEADIGSSYNAIPFDNTSQYYLSEFRGSARQSRLSLGVAGSPDANVHLSGYWESDFLTVGTSSNSNESNSYALRIRQFYAQAKTNDGWGFLAGQAWSTLTTSKSGVAGSSQHVPLTIDAQYSVGFDWARQWQLRAWKDFSNVASWAVALEGAASTVTAHGAPSNYLLGQAGGSLLNATANYTTDLSPDLVTKLAFEPGFGHWEIKAIGRVFRDRIINPSDTSSIGSYDFHTFGGGVGFGIWLPFNMIENGGAKRDVFDLGIDGLWGAGIGRYGSGQLADATIRPGGQINPIRAAHSLLSLEAHPSRHLDVYAYAGAEYEYRDSYLVGTKYTGYGLPNANNSGCTTEELPTSAFGPTSGTCTGDTRLLLMGIVGFWHHIYVGPYGNFQWGLQYTYDDRETWSGAPPAASPAGTPGLAPTAIDPMVFLSVRYYIP
jgi:hypothetical protein